MPGWHCRPERQSLFPPETEDMRDNDGKPSMVLRSESTVSCHKISARHCPERAKLARASARACDFGPQLIQVII